MPASSPVLARSKPPLAEASSNGTATAPALDPRGSFPADSPGYEQPQAAFNANISEAIRKTPPPSAILNPAQPQVDRAMLAGIVIALATVIAGIAFSGTSPRYFFQPAGALIVFGGTFGVMLITTPRGSLLHTLHRIAGLVRPPEVDRATLIDEIMKFAQMARGRSLLVMEPFVREASHGFLRDMLTLAVDGTKRQEMQNILETKVRLRERQGEADAKVLEVAAGFAPAIGVLGTVVGLIDVLRQFSNLSAGVSGIGTAFVSTIYGLGLANLVLLPAAHRIRARVAEIFETEEMIIQAGLCILDGVHPRLVREQLSCFLRQP